MHSRLIVEELVNPDEKVPFKDRLGRCYELAGRYVNHNPNATLVHGSIHGYSAPKRIGHAWVEIPSDLSPEKQAKLKKAGFPVEPDVWEPASNQVWPQDAFQRFFRGKVDKKYDHHDVNKQMLRNSHWGPWE